MRTGLTMTSRSNAEIGKRYGALVITEVLETERTPRGIDGRFNYHVIVKCACKCGEVVTRKKKVLSEGHSQHCGKSECKRTRMRSW